MNIDEFAAKLKLSHTRFEVFLPNTSLSNPINQFFKIYLSSIKYLIKITDVLSPRIGFTFVNIKTEGFLEENYTNSNSTMDSNTTRVINNS